MIPLRAQRFHLRTSRYGGQVGGQDQGFTVIEMLIALGLTLVIAGAVAQAVPPARAAFDRVPADLDLQQRGRMAIEVLSQALRSAGRNVAATSALGPLSDLLPTVIASDPDGEGSSFRAITVVAPAVSGAQGILASDQPGAAAAITLATTPCPNVKDVCGFKSGVTVLITDGQGEFDVFQVASTAVGARQLTPGAALSRAYPAGSAVVEVDQNTFSLAEQADGSRSLIRETAAGAVQPIVDFVEGLTFDVAGDTMAAGFFRLRQVDVTVRVQAQTGALRLVLRDRVFRMSIRLRNAP